MPARMYCWTVRATLMGPPKLGGNKVRNIYHGLIAHLPRIGVSNDWGGRRDARDHLTGLDKVVHSGDGQVGLAKAGSSGCSTTIQGSEFVGTDKKQRTFGKDR